MAYLLLSWVSALVYIEGLHPVIPHTFLILCLYIITKLVPIIKDAFGQVRHGVLPYCQHACMLSKLSMVCWSFMFIQACVMVSFFHASILVALFGSQFSFFVTQRLWRPGSMSRTKYLNLVLVV
jgi:hypothetical protein